jgi:MFS family permease
MVGKNENKNNSEQLSSICSYLACKAEFIRYKAIYFLIFAGLGIIFPYLPVYLEYVQLTKSQIGILSMIPNLAAFFVAPIFSILGDMLSAHYELMMISLVTSTVSTLCILIPRGFAALAGVVLITSILRAPLTPQIDALVISSLPDKTRYGEMRLWGAVSYGIMSLVGGIITADKSTESPDGSGSSNSEVVHSFRYIFYLHALFFLLGGYMILTIVNEQQAIDVLGEREENKLKDERRSQQLETRNEKKNKSIKSFSKKEDDDSVLLLTSKQDSSSTLTHNDEEEDDEIDLRRHQVSHSAFEIEVHTPQHKNTRPQANNQTTATAATTSHHSNSNKPQVSIFTALYRVLQEHPTVLVFSVVVFLSGFGSGVIEAFLFLRLKQLGGSGLVMGISRFITCAAEVPMFQVAGYLQKKYGVWTMMAVTQAAFVLRFVYYSLLTDPWAVLPCEVLHGLTFATLWSVSCSYANLISPPECHSTMQALLEGLHWGFGSGMGSLIGGFAYDRYGAVRLFEASACLSFLSFILSLLTRMYSKPIEKHEEVYVEGKTYSMVNEGQRLSSEDDEDDLVV